MENTQKKGLTIGVQSFLTALLVIFILMVAAYILTLIIPGGCYSRVPDQDGNLIIDTVSGFSYTEGGISFFRWLFSPILVLTAPGSGTIIAVTLFLLVIGGVFNALDKCGLMQYILNKTACKFSAVRYKLMAVIALFFMAMGAMIGSFEECVPLVPLVVALSVNLGWDALTGIGMSLLAAGCGFASGVCNPFTVGVAQQLAGLPMFSGIWLRFLSFLVIYLLLILFLFHHARKTTGSLGERTVIVPFTPSVQLERGMYAFAGILGLGIVLVFSAALIPALQDYTMIIVAVMFLLAGIVSAVLSGVTAKTLCKTFCEGTASIFPAIIMILMASSIKFTLEEANVLDTILYGAVSIAKVLPGWSVILFLYLIVLIMNFFIPSGSAKAFMLIPLILPLAQIFDISPQLCILAFAFGDGFSNVLYPTNPALLIALGLADVSYGKWFRWSIRFQLLNLVMTSLILLFGLLVGY